MKKASNKKERKNFESLGGWMGAAEGGEGFAVVAGSCSSEGQDLRKDAFCGVD